MVFQRVGPYFLYFLEDSLPTLTVVLVTENRHDTRTHT